MQRILHVPLPQVAIIYIMEKSTLSKTTRSYSMVCARVDEFAGYENVEVILRDASTIFALPWPSAMSIMFTSGLEDRAVRKNVDRRAPGLGPLLFRDLSSSFPRRAFEDLGERQLFGTEA